jgi:hypothetical protein
VADRRTGCSPNKYKDARRAHGGTSTSTSTPEQHGPGNSKLRVSKGASSGAGPSKLEDALSWVDGDSDEAGSRPCLEEAGEEGEGGRAARDDTDDSSTCDADAWPDGSGLERALPTIHFSCRSSVRDGIDTEFEVTSDSSSSESSLCSVSGPTAGHACPCPVCVRKRCSSPLLRFTAPLLHAPYAISCSVSCS